MGLTQCRKQSARSTRGIKMLTLLALEDWQMDGLVQVTYRGRRKDAVGWW